MLFPFHFSSDWQDVLQAEVEMLFINGGKILNLILLPLLSLITFSHVTDFSGACAPKDKSKICNSQWGTDQLNTQKKW